MWRRKWNTSGKKVGRYFPYLVLILLLLIIAPLSYSMNNCIISNQDLTLISSKVLSESYFIFMLSLLGTLIVVCIVIIFFSVKLRRVNKELQEKNKQILDVNLDLCRTNSELAFQKERMTKEHYESDKFYLMLVQSATDGISFYDRKWNLKYANSAFYSMVGLSRDSNNVLNPEDIIHQADSNYHQLRTKSLANKGFFESELKLKHTNGNFIYMSTRSVTVRNDNGDVLGALTIFRDITRLKQVHEDLIKANDEAGASNRLKSSFLANISHEIRTPLNSVVGFSNLLLENNLPDKVKEEYIGHINHNSEKLIQIIGDIIDLSRLESSQIEITYEETSLNSVVNEVIEEARREIKRTEKSIILNLKNHTEDIVDYIFTDRIWLKRVLNHLMDNAVKFTLEGSVEFSYILENGNIVFSIRDTGIGINTENLGHIFEEFKQESDGHHRPFEGLGIGLTLAKEVVERMGGKISVKSQKGIGSEFSFSIPYRPAGSSTKSRLEVLETTDTGVPIDWSSKKCLLVDDNKDVIIYLNRILIDTGVSVLSARSGREALDIIKRTPDIDVVLLDMQMPEMNGIEVTKEIKKIRSNLPIIAQTAFIFENDKDIILEAGCDACLIKPIRKEHLLNIMANYVKPN